MLTTMLVENNVSFREAVRNELLSHSPSISLGVGIRTVSRLRNQKRRFGK